MTCIYGGLSDAKTTISCSAQCKLIELYAFKIIRISTQQIHIKISNSSLKSTNILIKINKILIKIQKIKTYDFFLFVCGDLNHDLNQ